MIQFIPHCVNSIVAFNQNNFLLECLNRCTTIIIPRTTMYVLNYMAISILQYETAEFLRTTCSFRTLRFPQSPICHQFGQTHE